MSSSCFFHHLIKKQNCQTSHPANCHPDRPSHRRSKASTCEVANQTNKTSTSKLVVHYPFFFYISPDISIHRWFYVYISIRIHMYIYISWWTIIKWISYSLWAGEILWEPHTCIDFFLWCGVNDLRKSLEWFEKMIWENHLNDLRKWFEKITWMIW